jgi:hypothetical protein
MSDEAPSSPHWRLKISPELSIADILTLVCVGGPMLIWGAKMDHRVEALEKTATELAAEDRRAGERAEITKREFKEDLREISRKLDAIGERLPAKK